MTKKLLCLLMAALMLLSVVACAASTGGDDTETSDSSSTAASTSPSTDPLESEAGQTGTGDLTQSPDTAETPDTDAPQIDDDVTFDLPIKDLGGWKLVFLTRDESEWSTVEILPEADNEYVQISEAVSERNMILQDRYGLELDEIKLDTTSHGTRVQQEVSTQTDEFQAVVTSIAQSNGMLQSCHLTNLLSDTCSSYLDFTKSYWDGQLAEELKIGDRLFMATGDILTSDNDATFTILFNKTIATNAHLEDMYALVDGKQWTMSKMYEMMQTATNDKDGDGQLAYDSDVCGLAYTDSVQYCLMYAAGLSIVKRDEDGSFIFDLDVSRASNVAELSNRLLSSDYSIYLNNADTGNTLLENGRKCFGESHALFMGECMQCVSRMRTYDVDFGVLPFPMYDEAQGKYCSMLHVTGGVVGILYSVTGKKLEDTCDALEAMAYESVSTMTTLYYDLNLTSKNVRDEQSGPMIDLVMSSRVCDPAYCLGIGGSVATNLSSAMLPGKSGTVSSIAKSAEKQINRDIKNLTKKLNKYKD